MLNPRLNKEVNTITQKLQWHENTTATYTCIFTQLCLHLEGEYNKTVVEILR